MQLHAHATPNLKIGDTVETTGNLTRLIVIEDLGPAFRATRNDSDVHALYTGSRYHAVSGRPATDAEIAAYRAATARPAVTAPADDYDIEEEGERL